MFGEAVRLYQDTTGQFPLAWALVALLNLATQASLFYEMAAPGRATGEFGVFNAALGIIGLLTVPALAVPLALRLFFARAQSTGLDRLRESSVVITETFAWAWAAVCVVLLLLPFPLPALPRFSLDVFQAMNVLLMLGAVISGTVCAAVSQQRRWALMLVAVCLVRLALGGWITSYQPCGEAALAVYVVAGFITLAPALRPREVSLGARLKACASVLDASFLRFAAATLSVLLGLYLFTNADRIVALNWWNVKVNGYDIPSAQMRHIFDVYQATGLPARAVLWGTQPLLWMLYAERSKLDKTTAVALRFFWVYLGALIAGALAVGFLLSNRFLAALIPESETFGPTFAVVMLPLGLVQGLGIFSLASRRYPECYVIGACGIVYALVLDFVGGRPETMLPYMFGSSVVALMIVLFGGVVRWGRRQP